MRREVPLLTGTIKAYPSVMYSWICPKCQALHFSVKLTKREGDPVVICENAKCKEIYGPEQFKFNDLEKLKKVMNETAPEIYAESLIHAEMELMKGEAGDANASL